MSRLSVVGAGSTGAQIAQLGRLAPAHAILASVPAGDLSGLDVIYSARLHVFQTTGDERYRPSPQLEAKVKAGNLGRKTGRGWYDYS